MLNPRLKAAFAATVTFTLLMAGSFVGAQSIPRISRQGVGLHEAYVVQMGDTLRSLSLRHGIPVAVLAPDNNLTPAPDIYSLAFRGVKFIHSLADSNGLSDLINWNAVLEVVRTGDGIARDVTRLDRVSATPGK